jgi:hypothetical protein
VGFSAYDNDDYLDLIVTSYDRIILYLNNGDGTFTDATQKLLHRNHGRMRE